MIFSSTIPSNVRSPVSIAEYLAARFTYHGVSDWLTIIREGRVRINNKRCGADDVVKADDIIAYEPEPFEEPEADLSYKIIYEDEWMFAVDKPANLLVHRAGKSFRNNLVYQLRNVREPPYPACHPVYRLDRDTSGVVLFGKDAFQKGVLEALSIDKKVDKIYRAIVRGYPNIKTPFVIDAPIAKCGDNNSNNNNNDDNNTSGLCKFTVADHGKPSITIINDVRQINEEYSLLSIKLVTGRTHQIRVHLSFIGLPIAGDKVYGDDGDKNGVRFPRQLLHCESLSFPHPHTNKLCVITAELPDDFIFLGGGVLTSA